MKKTAKRTLFIQYIMYNEHMAVLKIFKREKNTEIFTMLED